MGNVNQDIWEIKVIDDKIVLFNIPKAAKMRDIVRAQDKTTRIVFNDRRLMRGHACSSATVLFGSFFFPLSFAQDSFLRGTLHGPCRARSVPRTGRDKGGFRDLITSSTIMHADTTHYRDVAKACHQLRRC